ncbi:hypothetical protein [Thermoproteus uzoniensis]|uniref:hypothetical protein n=1 Tax=Thermoproteus uzoniensis TaxID=184117 RepID=UPI001F23806B|nr:hypothetical protein [Thermoproteus uzoniensis]
MGIEVEGLRASATPAVLGEEGIYLLSSVAMEQLGLAPDLIEKRLKLVEALFMSTPSVGVVGPLAEVVEIHA